MRWEVGLTASLAVRSVCERVQVLVRLLILYGQGREPAKVAVELKI